MKYLLIFFAFLLLGSCTKDNPTSVPVDQTTGNVSVNLKIGPKGGCKRGEKSPLEQKLLLQVETSNPPLITYMDTLIVGGDDTVKSYQLEVNRDWSITAWVTEGGFVTHSSEPTPVNVSGTGKDTVSLYLSAMVSNLRVGFQAPTGGKRAFLYVNNVLQDTVSMKNVGEVVELKYSRLEATLSGILHRISLKIRGDILGFTDTLLYEGDTSILVKSGAEFQLPMNLEYIGPGADLKSTLSFRIQLGVIGTINLEAKLEKPYIAYEPKPGAGVYQLPSGIISKAVEFSLIENGFGKKLEGIKFESEDKAFFDAVDRAWLVTESGDTLSQEPTTSAEGEFISFRNVNLSFLAEAKLILVLRVKSGVSLRFTRFRCIRIYGKTNTGISVPGFFNGDTYSPWSRLCYFGEQK